MVLFECCSHAFRVTILWVLLSISIFSHVLADPDTVYGQVSPACDLRPTSLQLKTMTAFLEEVNFSRLNRLQRPVTISCGNRVMIEGSKSYTFSYGLIVEGELTFEDNAGDISLEAGYIFVRGSVRIGSKRKPFESNLRIELTDRGNDFVMDNLSGNNLFDSMMNFGTKAFVTYGGKINIFGFHNGPTFVKLVRGASVGDTSIVVDADVSNFWKPGDKLAIAPTTVLNVIQRSSSVTVRRVQTLPGSTSQIFFEQPLNNEHIYREVSLSDGSGRTSVLTPEVIKINRRIKITGMPRGSDLDQWLSTDHNKPHGGHFVIAHSDERSIVQGVEFVAMGQQGILGRYPIHFHFGSNARGSKVSMNSIHHSKQRCVVMHATHKVRIEKNVAFRIKGHCYVTEDGIEVGNTFTGNVAMVVSSVSKVITDFEIQSDDSPAGIWMISPTNHINGNIVSGAEAGYWFETQSGGYAKVRGQSRVAKLPGYDTIDLLTANMGKFRDNEAHHSRSCLATYANGLFPKRPGKLLRFFGWSCDIGWRTNNGASLWLSNSVFVDIFHLGAWSQSIENFRLRNVVFVAQLEEAFFCNGESTAISFQGNHHIDSWRTGLMGHRFSKVHLQGYRTALNCRPDNIGISLLVNGPGEYFPISSVFEGITTDGVDTPMKVSFGAGKLLPLGFGYKNFLGVRGSGHIIHTGFEGVDVLAKECQQLPWGMDDMLMCPNQCWRHVSILYSSMKNEYEPTSLRFSTEENESFEEQASEGYFVYGNPAADRMITKLMPSATYTIEIVGRDGKLVPKSEYDSSSFTYIKSDEVAEKPGPACKEEVSFEVNGMRLDGTVP